MNLSPRATTALVLAPVLALAAALVLASSRESGDREVLRGDTTSDGALARGALEQTHGRSPAARDVATQHRRAGEHGRR